MPKTIETKKFESKMQARRDDARAEGKLPPCECWDCLREAGLTPPKKDRHKYPSRYPFTVFQDEAVGVPIGQSKKEVEGEQGYQVKGEEGRHLANAIRNREAI